MIPDLSLVTWKTAPPQARARLKLLLLDLVGVGIGGTGMALSRIIRDHAAAQFGGGQAMLFDGRPASAAGVALAGGMTIDALDGHDGYNMSKGHVGCGLIPGLLALAPEGCSGAAFLDAALLGYETGARLGHALHATVPDYHTSGAWIAPAVALAGARLRGASHEVARHAAGIAEYHGPRSQMMRCIDHPTMVKDGSGWGAMAGVSALLLAEAGFTGAPALTWEGPEAAPIWADLGRRWLVLEQYVKPYPVCRWAQAPVEAALALRRAHGLGPGDIAGIEVVSFHESGRLASTAPDTTEQAQYSTAFPVAVALVHGTVAPEHIDGQALHAPDVRRLAGALRFTEDAEANDAFPAKRMARVRLLLTDGRWLESDWHQPRWDPFAPPTPDEVRAKFHALADPRIGPQRAAELAMAIDGLETAPLAGLRALLSAPVAVPPPQRALT